MLVLHVVHGPDAGRRHPLPPDEPQLIGRSSEALPISDMTVSRRHAELTPDRGTWYVRDLESANGTLVNGRAIVGRVALAAGDEIQCGSTVFHLSAEPDAPVHNPIRLLGPEEMDGAVAERVGPDEPAVPSGSSDPLRLASDHLRVIYELVGITAAAPRREELLPRVLDLVFREFAPDRGFILLQAEGSPRLEPAAVRYKVPPKTRDEGHIPVSRTIIQHVIGKSEGILATNAINDDRFRSGDSVRAYGIRTAICVPVRSGRRIMGVIHVDSAIADFNWTEGELRLMNLIGQHVGLALEGAEAVADAMRRERLAAMGEAVAHLSHSIKNILQGLRGGADAVELALARGDVAAAREGWPIVSRNLDRILSLTLNMLAWSRGRHLDIEMVAVEPLLREVAELVSSRCAQRGVRLEIAVPPDLPPAPMDPHAMHQALMNLVSNALEAVADRTGVVRLEARLAPDGEQLELLVSDNGPGIPAELRPQVFEPFVSSKGQRGTGLGLAVTRRIAEEHGGTVALRSGAREAAGAGNATGVVGATGGAGAAFVIALPLAQPEEEKGRTKAPRPGADVLEGEWE